MYIAFLCAKPGLNDVKVFFISRIVCKQLLPDLSGALIGHLPGLADNDNITADWSMANNTPDQSPMAKPLA